MGKNLGMGHSNPATYVLKTEGDSLTNSKYTLNLAINAGRLPVAPLS